MDEIRSVKFWLNAFLPQEIPGYTRRVLGGPYAGRTAVPGPTALSDCYLTDQRTFDNYIHASSRMHSEVRLDASDKAHPTMTQWHHCDETIEIDCSTGQAECMRVSSTDRMHFADLRVVDAGVYSVRLKGAANNPCSPSSRVFGDIDYEGTIQFDLTARSVRFEGLIEPFPAFELYATSNDGAGIALFRAMPKPGNTVLTIPSGANQRVRGNIWLP
jgi:hypothetical protein